METAPSEPSYIRHVSRKPRAEQKFYILEVLQGLGVTLRHFFQNLRKHIIQHVFRRPGEPGAVTIQYPDARRPMSPRLRTLHRLMRREDGSPRCVACMMCETICPARCIYIVAEEVPDPNIEKRPARFDVDLGRCVFCGYCVEACPEDAIRMDTGVLEFSAYSREDMVFHLEDLLNHKPVDTSANARVEPIHPYPSQSQAGHDETVVAAGGR